MVIDAISGHCYMLFVQAATWSAAEATCGALGPGTHVATIAAVRENTLVRQLAARRVWLGGTDVVVEGTWTWVDGAPFVYTNWASGEPNSDAFDCVEQIGNDPATWNEDDCNAPEAYVCEH